ncbi:putative intracellular septation protein [Rhodovulum sp. PH10]|uniref:septation protein A n=1 Tax=Rhodovulum sp. PH10 TaxID=1187851 RepID=UPI00027C233B|nr:septation protein A [Rhodovulum sp. PH10]EJW12382.1 putative intracellular septation protein [Rhodovulum sp. PH10]
MSETTDGKPGTDGSATAAAASRRAPNPTLKLALDLGPLVLFFVANAKFGIFAATATFMVAVLAALIASYALTRRLPAMPLASAVIVMVFGGLTLWLHDETFIKLKPTLVYLLFSTVLLVGLWRDKPLLALVLDQVVELTERGWRTLTIRWALFFLAMAVLNELVWRTQSTTVWVNFKLFGFVPLTIAFALFQMPLMNRHQAAPADGAAAKDGAAKTDPDPQKAAGGPPPSGATPPVPPVE